MKLNNRPILFFVKSSIIYLVFIGISIIPSVDKFIEEVFINSNRLWFKSRLENTRVDFKKSYSENQYDCLIHVRYSLNGRWNFMEYHLDSRFIAYIPKVLFLSLLIATVYSSERKKIFGGLIGLALTLALTHFLLNIRIYCLRLQIQDSLGFFAMNGKDRFYLFLLDYFASYTWIIYFIPILSWIAVSFGEIMNGVRTISCPNKVMV